MMKIVQTFYKKERTTAASHRKTLFFLKQSKNDAAVQEVNIAETFVNDPTKHQSIIKI